MSRILILGDNIEAITTATVMASLGHQVCISSPTQQDITHVVAQYAFEYQLVALWQLYISENNIQLSEHCPKSEHDPQNAADIRKNYDYVWLFLDGFISQSSYTAGNQASSSHIKISQAKASQAQTNQTASSLVNSISKNHAQLLAVDLPILLSGIVQVGDVAQLAEKLTSKQVFYVPFVFLQDGAGFASMLKPNLLLVGEKTAGSIADLPLLAPLIKQANNFEVNDIKTIEFTRSSMMVMLASRLSLINEMARLADTHQIDIQQVQGMMGLDKRIGSSYLNAGWGFGGRTLPKELTLLKESCHQQGVDTQLIQAIADINNDQKELIFRKFWQHFNSFVAGKTVLIWGAGYKAGSGRTLNSAIHPLLHLLWQYDIQTYVYDPNAANELQTLYPEQPKLSMADTAYSLLKTVDALFIINWAEPIRPNISELANTGTPVFDAQNLLTNAEISQLSGFYIGLGRAALNAS